MSDRGPSEVGEGQAPKPEMLEKAREVIDGPDLIRRVALALEEAVRAAVKARDEEWYWEVGRGDDYHTPKEVGEFLRSVRSAEQRASEASVESLRNQLAQAKDDRARAGEEWDKAMERVESLRKERDEARVCHICESHLSKTQVTCRWCVLRAFKAEYDEKLQKAIEAARAEAKKALEKYGRHLSSCRTWGDGKPPCACGLAEALAAIRAPRPAEPTTQAVWKDVNGVEVAAGEPWIKGRIHGHPPGIVCQVCAIQWPPPSSPTPPTSPTLGLSGYVRMGLPTPPSEEPEYVGQCGKCRKPLGHLGCEHGHCPVCAHSPEPQRADFERVATLNGRPIIPPEHEHIRSSIESDRECLMFGCGFVFPEPPREEPR